jgi:DNA-binding PadR family transcriptional regulator
MNILPRNEEIVLLAVWNLKENAFGLAIIDQIERDTGAKWHPGAVYGTLTRLKKNGYICALKTDQPQNQIGRPRIYYKVTRMGLKKLIVAQKTSRSIWSGVPDLETIG